MRIFFKRMISLVMAFCILAGLLPALAFSANAADLEDPDLEGKTISILGDSISTFAGVSNDTSVNASLEGGAIYYSAGTLGVNRADTWWQQTIDALGMELLVNNSWSGSCVLHTRSGTVGAYVDRCVQLHNDRTGEEPDIIVVFLGTNDFSYYQSALGSADIDYDTLITAGGDGSFTYATPTTTCEAYAIMLHKMITRYPDTEIYCMGLTARRSPDKADSYADVGQPTAFNAELQTIIEHFGLAYVDLENCGMDAQAEIFDLYMGDGRVHPNALGMDKITQALLSATMGKTTTIHRVSYGLNNVLTDHKRATVMEDAPFAVELTLPNGCSQLTVQVSMDGEDITDWAFADGKILIPRVNGDVVITASAVKVPANYRWEFDGTNLISVGEDQNDLIKQDGYVSNGKLMNTYYLMEEKISLRHDRAWSIEWKASGSWSGMLFSAQKTAGIEGNTYLFKTTSGSGFIGFGESIQGQYHNYGVALTALGVDTTTGHTYRLENRINNDGTNMVYLLVDGVDYGAVNHYFIGGTSDQGKTVDYVSEKDFSFAYIGSGSHTMNNCAMEYLAVWECVHSYTSVVTAPACTEKGYTTYTCECGDSYVDDYVDAAGHTYENGICTGCDKAAPPLEGRTISILGASISTYTGISNNTAYNATIGKNAVYYTEGQHGVYSDDTWWMQVCNDLGLRLLVNNSWSGSSLLHTRNGTVGAYVDRCVQLHNNAGEEPDIIAIQMGTNDFQYYKDTLGTADIDYDALIAENEDGSYTYATPVTSLEAAAIVLHKISIRYPNAEIYYLNISQRVDGTDELIQSFNAELKKVVEHFDAHIVDIYGSAITMDSFDTYIGDGRVHPNKLGMDAYTEAFKRALLENTACEVDTHTVSMNLDGVTADYGDDKIVVSGKSYVVNLSAAANMGLNVTVTMGSKDVTAAVYANGTVTIDSVTDDVTITAKAMHEPKDYRWVFDGTDLTCVSGDNALTKNAGSTTNGVFNKTRYTLENEVVLLHDLPWAVEWKSEGTFLNTSGSSGARIFTSDDVNANYNARYIFKSNTNGIIAMGEKDTKGSHNYGIALADHGIDWTALHTYRLENRIAADGSNMVWLYVDGKEIGPMNHYYVGTTDKNTTSDWLSGKDFVFPYMGTDTHGFTNASIEYIQVTECGHSYTSIVTAPTCTEQGYTTYTCTLCGDQYVSDYVDPTGLHNVDPNRLYNTITIHPGQLDSNTDDTVLDSDIYGYVVNYPLKKGHVLSISDTNYVFSVRKLENGAYSTMLKQATAASFTATEDMTVAMLIRKPDKSPVTAEELASIVICDSQFGMVGVEGSVRRFAVEAETIDGGTATTRAAIFLPDSYTEVGTPTRLIIMTNGRHGYLTDSVWNANTVDDVGVLRHYMENDYAVLVVNNTADQVNGADDWGNPQLVNSYWKAYEYVQKHLNVEELFSIHSRSMGTFAAVRMMRERPELIKCALMCGAVLSLQSYFGNNPAFMAKRYGFEDTTGGTWEPDKVVGYDPYTDVDSMEYDLPPTFWILSQSDAIAAHLTTIEKIEDHGNDVTSKLYTETDHSGVCRLNIEACRADSLAFLEAHQESTSEHRFCAWEVTNAATCMADGEMRRNCADCSHYETMVIPASQNHVFETSETVCDSCGTVFEVTRTEIPVVPGQLDSNSGGNILENDVYGSVVNYFLKKGHTLSISDSNYVFSVRVLANGNYSTMLKAATVDSFTATEDMTIGCLVRKPDKSALTEEELASIVLYDTCYAEIAHEEHNYNSVVTAPTCTEQGYTTYTCDCGDSYVDDYVTATGHSYENGVCTGCGDTLAGKTVSILSHSASTYTGVSNNTAYNSTIGSNDVYYTEGRHGVYRKDTWWQQTIDALGMRLLVNNSWSGSCVFMPRKGEASVGYGDRAVNLHNDRTGEEPDIIFVYLGCNDFAYYKDSFGKAADVDYTALIRDNGDETFSYAEPQTACEAYAIMLHKVAHRYSNAEIFCMTSTARRDPDYPGDSYPDAGQPTEYMGELHKVAAHFGLPVIDLESCIPKEATLFDQYMGDKRAHPNALGMDQITNEVISALLGTKAEIRHVTAENGTVAEQAVLLGGSYSASVEVPDGYSLTVTMEGQDITAEVYNDGKITIEEVTGDIAIYTEIQRNPLKFLWEIKDDQLISVGAAENPPSKLAGTITDGLLDDGRYALTSPVVLKHDLPWELEWQCAENWRGVVLSSDPAQKTEGMYYLSRTNGGQLCFGTWTGSQYDNYGIDLSGMDDQVHTYRLENRISADGSNMVWLYVDGAEIGPMNNYYVGSNSQNATSDWLSGKDFVFAYIGMEGHALRNCKLEYLQVTECVHTYENGLCTVCGGEHPNMANLEGKVISVMGDSISTFAGYIPVADGFNREHLARYPQDDLLTDVNETWWMQVVDQLDAKLGINDSWRGATLSGAVPVTTGDTGENAAMSNLTRIQNLGSNGTPDVILLYGGTNDLAHVSKIGAFDPETAPTAVDLTTKKWDNLADGFVHTILRMRYYYPDAVIVAMLPTYTASYYSDEKLAQGNAVMAQICEHYGIPYVDLRDSGVTAEHLPDGIHPGEEGMDLITQAVLDALLSKCEVEPGENVVYSVNHSLTNAAASLGHYKGISAGEAFVETLTGENLTVTVTMGGQDITESACRDGLISIDAVTGALHITARGDKKAAHADYLQQLPGQICCGSDLWKLLEHNREYYTVSGWGVHSSGNVRSVTIPVQPGQRIWATSFQAGGSNGGTLNGIRVTWFGPTDVLKSVTNDKVYEEFAANGWLTVPEGAVAVNIPMWTSGDENELYILTLDHSYENGSCTVCGAVLGDLDNDGDVDAYDLTLLARHVGGIELVTGRALLNADVDGDGEVDANDLTMHARYVGGIITSWDQE